MSTREGEDEQRFPGPPWMNAEQAERFFGWKQRTRVEAFIVVGIGNQHYAFVPHDGGYRVLTHANYELPPRSTAT